MTPRTVRAQWAAALALLVFSSGLAPAHAAPVGTAITYQGRLFQQGQLANGQFDFEFRPYDALTGGNAVTPPVSQTLQVTSGLFTTIIDLGNIYQNGQKLWLEIKVKANGAGGPLQVLAPRTEMTAVPTALHLRLPWAPAIDLAGDAVNLTNAGVGSALKIATKAPSPGASARVNNDSTGSALQVSAKCEKPEAAVKVFNDGKGLAIYGQSKVGRVHLEAARAPDISPEQFAGGGAESYAAATQAVIGNEPMMTTGTSSTWVPPGIGTISIGDIGIWGFSVDSVGVIGQNPWGVGVLGTTDSLSGATNPDPAVIGVRGYSAYGRGVLGETQGGKAVHGKALSGSGYAGYFDGAVQINGRFDVFGGPKNFLIDHPLDPDHRYLRHASIESAEMLNLYRGNVTLDPDGFAVITLPAWFEALNGDFSYQLTPIGQAAPGLYIADEIRQGKFRIGGGPAGARVSWMVTGVRHDRYALEHPLQVEQVKPESFLGLSEPATKGGKP